MTRPLSPQRQRYASTPTIRHDQFYLGSAYVPDGDLKKGLSLLDLARSINPGLGAAALRQSIIYAMLGRDDQACEMMQIFQGVQG